MNINISGDQDEMSAPARQGPLDHQIYDAMDQATTPATLSPGSEGLCYSDNEAVVERDETRIYF
jgi:hypothetical protein